MDFRLLHPLLPKPISVIWYVYSMQPNGKDSAAARVTMADVARAAGVSKPTVSRVLNRRGDTSPATIRKVEEAIERLGYRPSRVARSLTTRKTYTLGLTIPELSNPYFAEIAQGAELEAWKHGYKVFLCNVFKEPRQEKAVLESFEDQGVDGVILCSTQLSEKELKALLTRQRAAVLINGSVSAGLAGTITIDHAWGMKLAVDHLLRSGKRHLALLAGPSDWPTAKTRMSGFKAALESAGLEVDPDLIASCTQVEGAARMTRHLLAHKGDPDGIVCFNDIIAAGALKTCLEQGVRVPDDVAVIGNDDIPMASLLTPTLTTLRVPKLDIGASAVRMLLDRMAGRNLQMDMVFKPDLVLRQSAPS